MRSLLVSSGLLLAACSPTPAKEAEATAAPPPTLITEAEATALFDKVPVSLIAGNAAAVVANYTGDAVLIDGGVNDLITDAAANLAVTEGFIKEMAPTKFEVNQQKVQILDADTFVSTVIATGEMKGGQKQSMRVTQVAQKQADGSWKVVNEHLSMMPQPVTTPLPVVRTIPAAQ